MFAAINRSCRDAIVALPTAVGIILLSGCGGRSLGIVEGTVTLDGKPLDSGSVTFMPEQGPLAISFISPDGHYSLRTASQEGAKPGKYVVTVSQRSGMPSPGMTLQQIRALELVPLKYCDAATTDFRFEVIEGKNQIDLAMIK